MNHFAIVTATLLLAASPAQAGSMTFAVQPGVACPASPPAGLKCITVSDADLSRAQTAYKALCPSVDIGTKDARGKAIMRACTNAETVEWMALGIMRGVRDFVLVQERADANKTAGAAVAPIAGVP